MSDTGSTSTATKTRSLTSTEQNLIDGLEWHVNKLLDLVTGHDSVHPDRSECGGVGGCLAMAAEVEAEHELEERLLGLARRGLRVQIDAMAVQA